MSCKKMINLWRSRSPRRPLIVFLGVAAVCTLTATLILRLPPAGPDTVVDAAAPASGMPVTVCTFEPDGHAAVIKALGEVVPRWQTVIKSRIDGPIIFLAPELQVGHIVQEGDLLVRIAPSDFRRRVAETRSRLAAARVSLLKEERESGEARKNWQQAGIAGTPQSPLVWREPQLAAARAEVQAAQAALAHAETLLGYTDIRAPFDGVVIKRGVNPGETLFAGDTVATLYGMESAEVGVHLDTAQWALLPDAIEEIRVTLTDSQQQVSWNARVVREGRHLRRDSRLRTLFLEVTQPLRQTPPLLPGTFVRADILGRTIPDLLRLPESALTPKGQVWFVDPTNRLQPRPSAPVFYGKGVVYTPAPPSMDPPLRVAIAPNNSFTGGLAVQPIAAQGAP